MKRVRWEYKNVALDIREGLIPLLQRFGADGWEAWHFFVGEENSVGLIYREVFFKRQISVDS